MAQNPTYNDGGIVYGTPKLTRTPKGGGSPVVHIADNFQTSEKATNKPQTDEFGQPRKQLGIPEVITGSATLQIDAANSNAGRGDTFTTDLDSNVKVWIIDGVDKPYMKDDYLRSNITFREKLN